MADELDWVLLSRLQMRDIWPTIMQFIPLKVVIECYLNTVNCESYNVFMRNYYRRIAGHAKLFKLYVENIDTTFQHSLVKYLPRWIRPYDVVRYYYEPNATIPIDFSWNGKELVELSDYLPRLHTSINIDKVPSLSWYVNITDICLYINIKEYHKLSKIEATESKEIYKIQHKRSHKILYLMITRSAFISRALNNLYLNDIHNYFNHGRDPHVNIILAKTTAKYIPFPENPTVWESLAKFGINDDNFIWV